MDKPQILHKFQQKKNFVTHNQNSQFKITQFHSICCKLIHSHFESVEFIRNIAYCFFLMLVQQKGISHNEQIQWNFCNKYTDFIAFLVFLTLFCRCSQFTIKASTFQLRNKIIMSFHFIFHSLSQT